VRFRNETRGTVSSADQLHDERHAEVVGLYAMQALPAAEMPAAEAQIAACEACRREIEELRPLLESFADWPRDVLRPMPSLWGRVAERVSADSGQTVREAAERWVEPDWKEVAPGITVKMLATDTERDLVTMLVHLDPGVDYPPHSHAGMEELFLLDGELWIDDRKLYPGDYSRAEPGTSDSRVWSETGCTCVLITSPSDILKV